MDSAQEDGTCTDVFLVTANVGSLFEDVRRAVKWMCHVHRARKYTCLRTAPHTYTMRKSHIYVWTADINMYIRIRVSKQIGIPYALPPIIEFSINFAAGEATAAMAPRIPRQDIARTAPIPGPPPSGSGREDLREVHGVRPGVHQVPLRCPRNGRIHLRSHLHGRGFQVSRTLYGGWIVFLGQSSASTKDSDEMRQRPTESTRSIKSIPKMFQNFN